MSATTAARHNEPPSPATSAGEEAIHRVLEILSRRTPGSAARATTALDRFLSGIRSSPWPDVAWSFSRLTLDRFPVEFTFCSGDAAIRYTTEIGGPELAEAERLGRAVEELRQLSAAVPKESMRLRLQRVQESGPLRFGTWIGGRHAPGEDRYKLYAEAPRGGSPEVAALVRRYLGEDPLLPGHDVRLHMIGLDPTSSRIELYFRGNAIEPWEIGTLLRRAGLPERRDDLLQLVEEASGESTRESLPGTNVGFSFSFGPEPLAFSLFFFARSVFGGDGRIRRGILSLAERKGWDFSAYEAVTAPLTNRTGWRTDHLTVAFVVSRDGAVSLGVGIRPPGRTA
jgi:hypothetical protein